MNQNLATTEKTVCLVTWEEKSIRGGCEVYGVVESCLPKVLEHTAIRPYKFSQPQETIKPREEERKEKEVIVYERLTQKGGQVGKMGDMEWLLSMYWGCMHFLAPCKRLRYKVMSANVMDIGIKRLKTA